MAVFSFLLCTFLASIAEGGGGIAVTYLTANVSDVATVLPVSNNRDFVQAASLAYPQYIQIDDEIIKYSVPPPNAISFNPVVRAQADPTIAGATATTATTHLSGAKVQTLQVVAMNSFLGQQITSSTSGFGVFKAFGFVGAFFSNMPKFLTWDYNFLTGQLVYLKYFVLYPLSAGFAISMCYAMLILAMGAIKFL
jgi:hypothetical protein